MSTALNHLDLGSFSPPGSALPDGPVAPGAPADKIQPAAQPVPGAIEIQAAPAATSTLANTAKIGWTSSVAVHVTAAIAVAALAVFGPELPSIGGRTSDQPIALTVEPAEAELTPASTVELATDTACVQPSPQIVPHVEPVEHRDPVEKADQAQRPIVDHSAPAISSPPMMDREDAHSTKTSPISQASRRQEPSRRQKLHTRPVAMAAAARLPITKNAAAYDNPKPTRPDDGDNLSGTVVLRLHIDATGRVRKAEIHRSSGHRVLDQAASRTVLARWRFHPARSGTRPVGQVVLQPVVFL